MSNKKHQLDYVFPPDIEKCKNHRLATRIFKGLTNDEFSAECQCCERRIGNKQQQGECCYDNIKLAFIGPGIPLLFTFIKNCIILLISVAVIFVAFAFYSNLQGGNCQAQGSCSDNIFDTFAIINKISQTSYLTIQNYMLLGFVIFSLFLMQYFRYSFRKIQDQCDDRITSPSDYALILRRLPEGTQQIDILKMIEAKRAQLTPLQIQKTQNLRVVSIVMSFAMGEYTKTKIANKQQFSKLLGEDKHGQFTPKPRPPLEKTASVAIIVFGRQESKQLFQYKPNIFQKLIQCFWTPCIPRSNFVVKGQKVAVQRAPQPDDIVWQNTKISQKGAICRKALYSLFSIVLLLIGGGIQFGLAVAQTKVSNDAQTQMIMSTFSSIAVSVINAVIQIFLVFTSKKERNQTITQYNTVLMVKISFFQFLNTGVFVVLANFLAQPNNFSLSKGFVFQITQVMILNAIIPNLSLFILTYCEIIPKIKRCLIERGTIKNSQLEANGVFQGPQVQLPYKYAYIFKTIWLTAFYAPLTPIVVPISMVGLFLNYIIQKCLFGKVYSIPNTTSSMVNDSAIELLQYFPFILSIGEFIIYLYFLNFKPELLPLYWSIPIYASLAISCINLLLPMDALNQKLFKMPSDNFVYPSYEKVEERFQVNYEMTNPGYVCKRKRKRDLFILDALFGKGETEMTGLGMLVGGLGPVQSDTKTGLMGQQNPIYNNPNPSNLNINNINDQNNINTKQNLQNPNLNNMNNNPFAALLAPIKPVPSPTNRNIKAPVASPQNINNKKPIIELTGAGLISNQNQGQNQNNPLLNQSIPTNNQQNNSNLLNPINMPQNYDNVPLTFNGNNSMLSSVTGAFPSIHNRTNPINQIPNQSYMQATNNLTMSNVSLPVSQPPLNFNQMQMGFNNQMINNHNFGNPNFGNPTFGMGNPNFENPSFGMGNPISPQMINLANLGPIPYMQQSQRSYSSTRQIRKALKFQQQVQK